MSPHREAVIRVLWAVGEWLGRKWFRIDSWIRGEQWPNQWAIYFEKIIPLEIADAVRAGAASIFVPAHWTPYNPAFQRLASVQMIADGGAWGPRIGMVP